MKSVLEFSDPCSLYLSASSQNAGKYGPEKLRTLTIFTQHYSEQDDIFSKPAKCTRKDRESPKKTFLNTLMFFLKKAFLNTLCIIPSKIIMKYV